MDIAYDILNITAHCKKKSCKIYGYIKKIKKKAVVARILL